MKKAAFGIAITALLGVLLILNVSPLVASWMGIPEQVRVFPGTEFSMSVQLPFSIAHVDNVGWLDGKRQVSLIPEDVGREEFQIKLFGFIPVRQMIVEVVPEIKLLPGGHSIGVMLNPQGLIVSRIIPVQGLDGREYFPAGDAGIRPGDVLISINDIPTRRPDQVSQLVNTLSADHEQLKIKIQRNNRTLVRTVRPVRSERRDIAGRPQQRYLIGLLLKDPAVGVGTMTFYDPVSGRYAALGHTITDDRGRSLEIEQGSIVPASIDSVKEGVKGIPGEKLGTFLDTQEAMGTIDRNTPFGIFGRLRTLPEHPYFTEPIGIGLAHQVEVGPAEIYTVIDGDRIERFSVEITRVTNQSKPDDKGLVLKITDSRLLKKTGGIVQGMSGSPIVQNGLLIGAVTHVFINDPTRGYGNLIEWMVYDAGLVEPGRMDSLPEAS